VEQVRVSQLARGGGRRIPTQLSGAKAARGGNFGSVLHRGPQDLELLLATDERGEGSIGSKRPACGRGEF